jgi:hypothetical protein
MGGPLDAFWEYKNCGFARSVQKPHPSLLYIFKPSLMSPRVSRVYIEKNLETFDCSRFSVGVNLHQADPTGMG